MKLCLPFVPHGLTFGLDCSHNICKGVLLTQYQNVKSFNTFKNKHLNKNTTVNNWAMSVLVNNLTVLWLANMPSFLFSKI